MENTTMPALPAMEKRVNILVTQAHMLNIKDQMSLSESNDQLIGIKVLRQEIGKTFKPMKDKARETVKEIQARWDSFDNPLVEAITIHERGIAAYVREQERKRREAQALIDQKAKEVALAAAIELEKEEKKRKKAARDALAKGDMEKYQELVSEEPVQVTDPGLMGKYGEGADIPETPEIEGSTVIRRWKFKIIDPNQIPMEYKKIDEVKIGSYVRAMKESAKIPGVKIYYEDTVSSRINR